MYIQVGRILKPYGVNGALRVASYTQNPGDLFGFEHFWSRTGESLSFVLRKRADQKPAPVMVGLIDGVITRTDAATFSGIDLFVKRTDLPDIPKEAPEFYHVDLIGLDVFFQNRAPLGQVIGVYNFGAGDVLEIEHHNTIPPKTDLIAFHHAFVLEVDLEKKRLVIVDNALPTEKDARG